MFSRALLLVTVFLASQVGVAFTKAPAPSGDESAVTSSSASFNGPTVWITRPDGGQQCAPGTAQSLETSSTELQKAQVRILSSQKGGDRKLRAQVCGIPTGKTNTFQIPKEDLPKAVALGFHEVPAPQEAP
jgi:hypothetical protein